ncbi:MAG: M15 family metallopeptidase [Bacilli bacterium]|nr:M15 family metallopeptidase [Bacilli bacterium]
MDINYKDRFVVVSEIIKDCLLDIRYYSSFNFVGTRVDGYLEPIAILTKEACDKLNEANEIFKKSGYIIKIFDCYRPQKAVNHFVRWASDVNDIRTKEYFYPNVNKKDLFDLGFVSKKSGHSRGSTVDLTLVNMKTGESIDMGGGFDYFGELSHSDYQEITIEQYNNRLLLRNIMVECGFKTIKSEWWHFTLIDEPFKDTYFDFDVKKDF